MTVKEFIKKLESLKDELKDIEIKVRQPNGILTTPEIKFVLNSPYKFPTLTKENVKFIIIK